MTLHLSANSSVTDTRHIKWEVLPSYKISLFLMCCKVTKCRLPGIVELTIVKKTLLFPVGRIILYEKLSMVTLRRKTFDSPYYGGTTDFNIRGGRTTPVKKTTCKLANTKISIEYWMISNGILRLILLPYRQSWENEVSSFSSEEKHVLLCVKPGKFPKVKRLSRK